MTKLGADWLLADDGIPTRNAARVLVFDAEGKTLLVRGHDTSDPQHTWWFAVGGGLLPEEDPLEGAVRELAEETGITFCKYDLVGPVLARDATFRFSNVTARQKELFYLAFLNDNNRSVSPLGLSQAEQSNLDEFRWFTASELADLAKKENVYPVVLPDLIDRWRSGWDGKLVRFSD